MHAPHAESITLRWGALLHIEGWGAAVRWMVPVALPSAPYTGAAMGIYGCHSPQGGQGVRFITLVRTIVQA